MTDEVIGYLEPKAFIIYHIPEHCGHKVIYKVTMKITKVGGIIKEAEQEGYSGVHFEGWELVK